MYLIRHFCHLSDRSMGAHDFAIELHPDFRDRVAKSGITQEIVDSIIQEDGKEWLKAAGYGSPLLIEKLRVKWGEWGPEHITVPGNSCGLDLEKRPSTVFRGGARLNPHNIDSLAQKYLLTIVFTELAVQATLYSWKAPSNDKVTQ